MSNDQDRYWIKEGTEVAHRTDLTSLLFVSKLIKKSKVVDCILEKEDEGTPGKRRITFLEGVVCRWFEDGKLRETIFHSKELIPYEVAQEGFAAVNNWLKEKNT